MAFEFRSALKTDAGAISELALALCEKFIFPGISSDGRKRLEILYSQMNLENLIETGNPFFTARFADELVGAAAMKKENRHIFLMFVAEHFQRRNLGSTLVMKLLSIQHEQPAVTLNSSLFATEFYKSLGFNPSGPVERKHGVVFLPMRFSEKLK